MNKVLVVCILFSAVSSLMADVRSPLDMAVLRSTNEGRSIRWIECNYDKWRALACWFHSDEKRQTFIQVFILNGESKWRLLHDEAVPYAKADGDHIHQVIAVPESRVFMVINRSGLLEFSYLGYDEENEPNRCSERAQAPVADQGRSPEV